MIGSDARQRSPDGADLGNVDGGADKGIIDAQRRKARRKGRLPAAPAAALRVGEPRAQAPVTRRARRRVEVAEQDDGLAALGMAEPIGTEQGIDLPPLLA